MVRLSDHPDMTRAVDWDIKQQTKIKLDLNVKIYSNKLRCPIIRVDKQMI